MTKPGLQIEYLHRGAGEAPRAGDTVVVHYTGWLTDGVKFDSSLDRGEPFAFRLGQGQVIEGWDLGLAQMRVGDRVRLTILPELAYGDRSPDPLIPAHSTLVFEVELLEVRAPRRPAA
jgi:FKBP-type peptidyl-prolyl cis-trans isomerase